MQLESVDRQQLAARLRAQRTIDDPVTGNAPPADMESKSPLWPTARRWQKIERVAVTEQGQRRVEEFRFTPVAGGNDLPPGSIHGEWLPVAIVFEQQGDGSSVARVYSAHQLVPQRGPILEVVEDFVAHRGGDDIMARYFTTLHSAQMEPTLDLWEVDGYLQHSNGETYQGRERLRVDFTKFYATGGIKLRYCNKVDSGPRTALEVYMPAGRPAVAVYERGAHGKVGAARLYL
ncbi:MAG TPA: hypothetical protein VMI92_01205 [Steroidobacteraceae bacterium]|nr:hypothetical protein [Steroidobacteraceae bacterium]